MLKIIKFLSVPGKQIFRERFRERLRKYIDFFQDLFLYINEPIIKLDEQSRELH